MYRLELADIMFYVTSRKNPDEHFNINNFITPCTSSTHSTRSSSFFKLKHHTAKSNLYRHSYFYRLPRLWNSLPPIDLNCSVLTHLISHFTTFLNPNHPCTYHYLCPCNSCFSFPSPTLFY